MHTLARSPVCEARLKRQVGNRAFTLIELLTVIAIIAILAGISFGVIKGVNERAAIGQAKAELAVLSQALEAYKMQYGDYPRTRNPDVFLQSLIGRVGPKGDPMTGKALVEVSKLTLNVTGGDPFVTPTLYLIDPWGRRYNYYYKIDGDTSWKSPNCIVMSAGPNGYIYGTTGATGAYTTLLNNNGTLKADAPANSGSADNIYGNN